MRRTLLSLTALLLLSGCSTYVTVVTEPEGAMISDLSGSQLYGYSPVQIEYGSGLPRDLAVGRDRPDGIPLLHQRPAVRRHREARATRRGAGT